jgi:hypothetical protein
MKTDHALPIGRWIQLLIDWPTKLDKSVALWITVKGKILRSTAEGTAVKFLEYEFRVHSPHLYRLR